MKPSLRLLLSAAVLLPLAGCASATGQPTAVAPACTALPPSGLPDSSGSLTEADTGTFCLPVGGRVDVLLTARPTSDRWRQPENSAPHVLGAGNSGIMTPPVGVTVAFYSGRTPGTAILSSDTPSGRHWQATLVVRPK